MDFRTYLVILREYLWEFLSRILNRHSGSLGCVLQCKPSYFWNIFLTFGWITSKDVLKHDS